ncbi:MAG: hypothetical protein JXA45_02380 [Methanomassiliicoccales archaeon]|nr:hypothetical protein [Methanomassiliicoccales archaeon]
MIKVREARTGDLRGLENKENRLGGPTFSLSALEVLMKAPDFSVQVAGGSVMVLHHEGRGGTSHILLLTGPLLPDLLEAAESCSRSVGATGIAVEVDPRSAAVAYLQAGGYVRRGESANHFGRGRPAWFMERPL